MRAIAATVAAVVVAVVSLPAFAGPKPGLDDPAGLVLKVSKRTPRNPGGPAAAAPAAPGDASTTTTPSATAPSTSADPLATPAPEPTDLNGGHRDTLADCMSTWDKGTHMTKTEWRATCLRNMQPHRGI
jgi:hypothetical protein